MRRPPKFAAVADWGENAIAASAKTPAAGIRVGFSMAFLLVPTTQPGHFVFQFPRPGISNGYYP